MVSSRCLGAAHPVLTALMLLLVEIAAFAPSNKQSARSRDLHQLFITTSSSMDDSRREFIINNGNIACLLLSSLLVGKPAAATASNNSSTMYSTERPVAILGGGGRLGKEVAAALAKEGLYGVAMTRTGKAPVLRENVKEFVQPYAQPVNVNDADGLMKAMQSIHASAIVYCASASAQGGTAFQVDDEGVANAAAAAKALDARFILVSALGVDRPESKGFKMTNSLGGNYDKIMDAKRHGEEKTRSILAKGKNYMIVRPGPFLNVKSRNGAVDIELNQGDMVVTTARRQSARNRLVFIAEYRPCARGNWAGRRLLAIF